MQRRRMGTAARIRTALLLGVLLFVLWGGGDLAYVSTGNVLDEAAHADVIIVLGCNPYNLCIKARADHAAGLYRRGLASHIIPTGGSSGEEPVEADMLAQLLQADGVPLSAIFPENKALDTIQNIENSRAIMSAHSWHTAILVTEPYHIKRATLIARDAGLTVFPSPAVESPNWQVSDRRARDLARDTISLMLYQVKSLFGIKS
ncbi:MAG: YdcF family protein [Chloroflexota bacterium]|nr:YdcF family protein [Chloroflexota bacterium]